MSLTGLTEKQLRDRMSYLSDRIDSIWETKLKPYLDEFDSMKLEFNELLVELEDRGLLKSETNIQT